MKALAVTSLVIIGICALVGSLNYAYKEGYIGRGYNVSIEYFWDGNTMDGTVMNNATRKVRCLQAEYDLIDKNNHSLEKIYLTNDSGIAAGKSVSFSITAAAQGAQSIRQSNIEFVCP